jgi:WD40 repeat protein
MLYDRDGEMVEKFPQTWGPELAFAADGSVAITTIDESVTVRLCDGQIKTLAPTGDVIRRNTSGITAKWVGRTLFVRTIRALRTWDMNSEEVEHAGTQWDFAGDEVSVGMDAGKDWAAVSLSNGQIVLFKTREMVEVERLVGHQGLVADLRFGKGDKLTSVGEDGSLRVWFPSTGVNIDFEKPIHETQPNLWTVSPEADLGGDPPPAAPGRPYGTRATITTPDGKRSMTTGDDGLIRIWNPTGPELVLSLKGPARLGLQLAISKDGRKLAGQFLTPGNDWNYEQVWSTELWTRETIGLNPEQDWKAAFEAERLKRYKAGWNGLTE